MSEQLPAHLEVGTCARCGRGIVWEFDDPTTSNDNPYGFWYDQEYGTEACTPGPADDDRYHDPYDKRGR